MQCGAYWSYLIQTRVFRMSNANGNDKVDKNARVFSCVASGQDILSAENLSESTCDSGRRNKLNFLSKTLFTVCRICVTVLQCMKVKNVLFI